MGEIKEIQSYFLCSCVTPGIKLRIPREPLDLALRATDVDNKLQLIYN